MTRARFPTLYKLSSTGALQRWDIRVEPGSYDAEKRTSDHGATIFTRWGQDGGAIQEGRDVIGQGKNVGKKNETTPFQQACLEAESRWKKQKKNKGYVETVEAAQAGQKDALVKGGCDVMLAERYDEHGDELVFPCYVQPKLDGHRCTAHIVNGEVSLWSRTRKPISQPHIEKALAEAFPKAGSWVLDGELYNHKYAEDFEGLTSLIKDSKDGRSEGEIEYHVYDLINNDPFEARWAALKAYVENSWVRYPVVLVKTVPVTDEDDMMVRFEEFLAKGYEGLMARNTHGLYRGHPTKRSRDLLKVKEFKDYEFKIEAIEEGRGKMAGHAIFVCRTPAQGDWPGFKAKIHGRSVKFNAKMKGDHDKLAVIFQNAADYLGRTITVKYQNLYKSGAPRFPVAVRFREDV